MKDEKAVLPEVKYGFVAHLKAAFPSQFVIDVSELCNLACIHCPHPEFKKSQHFAGRLLDPLLNRKLIDEIAEYGAEATLYLRYAAQGEPMTHPKLFEMTRYAADHVKAAINLTTNGALMSGKWLDAAATSGINVFDISIDAFRDDTYARIRVHGHLADVIRNIRELIKLRDQSSSRFQVITSFVEQDLNIGETDDFKRFWEDEGCDFVLIRRLHSCSGAKENLASDRRGRQGVRRPCLYPWERITLGPDGWLEFCPQDWVHASRVADYRTTTVKETWQNEFYRRLREAHLSNDFSQHAFCGQCPDWSVTQWPHDERRSYAEMMKELVRTDV
jgi:MoaA/NifB/PqqE/SkfB family radical SAM enzyme